MRAGQTTFGTLDRNTDRMKTTSAIWVSLAACCILLAACDRQKPAQTKPAKPVPVAAAPNGPAAPQIPAHTAVEVNWVDSVSVTRPADSPQSVIIQASGTVPSGGWTNPTLVPDDTASSDGSIKSFKFTAMSPQKTPQTPTAQTVQAQLRIDNVATNVMAIRVVADTNAVSAPLGAP